MRHLPVLLAFVLVCSQAGAQTRAVTIPAGGISLLPDNAPAKWRVNARPGLAITSQVRVTGQPFTNALQVTVLRVPEQSWGVQAVTQIEGGVRKGDVLLLSCWVRCVESTSEDGEGQLRVNVQQNRAPYQKLLALPVSTGGEWQQVVQPFRSALDLPDGNSNITFHLGLLQQQLLIADIQLLNFGKGKDPNKLPTTVETYRGRSLNAAWREAAGRRIELLRRAPLTVTVRDAAGRPAPRASITVKMLKHEFTFGSAVAAKILAADTDDSQRYRETVKKDYNKIVFENDLKWDPWNISKSNAHNTFRREWTQQAFNWLQKNNIAARGHYVTWAPLKPRQVAKYRGDGELLRKDLWEHMQDKLPEVGGRVTDWDVINHIVGWGETIESVVGTRQVYADIVQRSRELVPEDVQLWINEGQVLPSGQRIDAYEAMAQFLNDHGAAPDGIGFMGHFGAHSLTPPDRLYEVFDQFAKLSDNLQITELDVNVGRDEYLQADYLRDVMTIAFSHPNMRSIMMWGFWEGRHWKPDAALYRRDWSIKPAGKIWRELVFDRWWTNASGTTDDEGGFSTNVFLGEYQIDVKVGDKRKRVTTTLTKPGRTVEIVLQ